MSRVSIRPVTTLDDFETLGASWNGLLKRVGSDNVFLTWEWLYTWAKHYLRDRHLWIIVVYDPPDQLLGIAPFYIRPVTWYGLLRVREMRFLGTEAVGSPYLDFIVPRARKKAVLHAIYEYLHRDISPLWDALTLSQIPAESSTIDLWDSFNREAGNVMEFAAWTACPLIDLTSHLDDFLAAIGRNERYNLRRKQRRLSGMGTVVYERARTTREVEKAFDTFIELHRMRWAQRAPVATFGNHTFSSFHRDIARLFSEQGWARLDFLRLNGEAIAGVYGYSYNDHYSFYLPGFNPDVCPKASPGILLLYHCIEEAIAEGQKQFDLLRGITDYKMAWANGLRRALTFRHYNRHLRSKAARLLQHSRDTVKALVR